MDTKQYYKKIKDTEETIEDAYPLVVSKETPEGGKAGVVVEVPRRVAAQMIVDNRAELANDEQKAAFCNRMSALKEAAEKAEMARRLQFAVISDADLRDRAVQPDKNGKTKGTR